MDASLLTTFLLDELKYSFDAIEFRMIAIFVQTRHFLLISFNTEFHTAPISISWHK